MTLNDRFNLGMIKRMSFPDNGKTLVFDAETILHNATPGTYDQWLFPDIEIDSSGVIHMAIRLGNGHNNDTGVGYIAYFTITWNGNAWVLSDPVTARAADPNTWIITNPSIFITKTGKKIIFFTKVSSASQGSRECWYVTQEPGQSSWSEDKRLTTDFGIPGMIDGPQKCIQMPSGRLLIARYAREDGSSTNRKVVIYYSDDDADTWAHFSDVTTQGIESEEPSLLLRDDGLLICGIRRDPGGALFRCSYSKDGGQTWSGLVDMFTSNGKNPLAKSPNGTIATMGRGTEQTSLIAWSANGGQSFDVQNIDDRQGEWRYMYGGVVWHSILNKFVFVYTVAPDEDWETDPTMLILHTWNEVDAS